MVVKPDEIVYRTYNLLQDGQETYVFGLFDQFLGAAETDPVLAEWFLRRTSMLDSLWLTPPPRIVGRAIRHNIKAWLAERRGRHNASETSVTARGRSAG